MSLFASDDCAASVVPARTLISRHVVMQRVRIGYLLTPGYDSQTDEISAERAQSGRHRPSREVILHRAMRGREPLPLAAGFTFHSMARVQYAFNKVVCGTATSFDCNAVMW
jgi:hypothetical protein